MAVKLKRTRSDLKTDYRVMKETDQKSISVVFIRLLKLMFISCSLSANYLRQVWTWWTLEEIMRLVVLSVVVTVVPSLRVWLCVHIFFEALYLHNGAR